MDLTLPEFEVADPDAIWAASGAMALTGRDDGPPLLAPPTAVTGLLRLAAALRELTPVVVDGPALLGERAATAGFAASGGCQLRGRHPSPAGGRRLAGRHPGPARGHRRSLRLAGDRGRSRGAGRARPVLTGRPPRRAGRAARAPGGPPGRVRPSAAGERGDPGGGAAPTVAWGDGRHRSLVAVGGTAVRPPAPAGRRPRDQGGERDASRRRPEWAGGVLRSAPRRAGERRARLPLRVRPGCPPAAGRRRRRGHRGVPAPGSGPARCRSRTGAARRAAPGVGVDHRSRPERTAGPAGGLRGRRRGGRRSGGVGRDVVPASAPTPSPIPPPGSWPPPRWPPACGPGGAGCWT